MYCVESFYYHVFSVFCFDDYSHYAIKIKTERFQGEELIDPPFIETQLNNITRFVKIKTGRVINVKTGIMTEGDLSATQELENSVDNEFTNYVRLGFDMLLSQDLITPELHKHFTDSNYNFVIFEIVD